MSRSRGTILHLIDTGGPGGAETIFLELVSGLEELGWHSVPVVPSRDWLHATLVERGLNPVLVRSRRSLDAAYLLRLLALGVRERVVLIQTHLLASAVYGSVAARLLRIPLVATFHGIVDLAASDRLLQLKRRLITRRRGRVVFVSESLRRGISSGFPIPPELTRVILNGIELPALQPRAGEAVRRELGLGPDALLLLAVGNVRPAKDYFTLLRAMKILRTSSPRYHLVIAGDTRAGTLYERLLALRAELGLEAAVTFCGFQKDVVSLLTAADAFVLSSDREGFSLSTVQALAVGTPVVATRCGGPEEIVSHGHDGWLVPPADPPALAAAIDHVLGDPQLRGRMVCAGRHTAAERFGVDRMVADYAAVYHELLDANRADGFSTR